MRRFELKHYRPTTDASLLDKQGYGDKLRLCLLSKARAAPGMAYERNNARSEGPRDTHLTSFSQRLERFKQQIKRIVAEFL